LTVAFVLPVHATASGGLPNIDPVGGPVEVPSPLRVPAPGALKMVMAPLGSRTKP
jgi:hypothetical protein